MSDFCYYFDGVAIDHFSSPNPSAALRWVDRRYGDEGSGRVVQVGSPAVVYEIAQAESVGATELWYIGPNGARFRKVAT